MLCKLSYWAPELHGFVATWPFFLPSLGKACLTLMQIYGELNGLCDFPSALAPL